MSIRPFLYKHQLCILFTAVLVLPVFFAGCDSTKSEAVIDPMEALAAGDYTSAITELNRQILESPEDANLLYTLGLAYYRMGEALAADESMGGDPGSAFSDSGQFFRKALALVPTHQDAGLMLARALYMNNDLERAYEAVNRCLESHPDNAEALEAAAQIGLMIARQAPPEEGKAYTDKAVTRLEKAIEIEPGMDLAYIRLGDCYLQMEQVEPAAETYRKGIEACTYSNTLQERLLYLFDAQAGIDPTAEIAFYDRLLAREAKISAEDEARLWWFKGSWLGRKATAHYEREEFDLAGKAYGKHLECLKTCADLFSGFKTGSEDIAATVRVNRAWSYIKLERFEEAEKDLFTALDHDPENERTIFAIDSLGFAISRKTGFTGARDFFKRLTSHYGKRHKWWNDYGFFSLESNMRSEEPNSKYEETLLIYQRALELVPDYPRYLNDAAMVIDYYLDPEGKRSAEVEAMFKKAWTLGKEKYDDPFTDEAEKVVMFSSFTDALVNLSGLYLKQGRLKECGPVLDALLEAAPDRVEAVELKKAYKEALEKTPGGNS